MIQLENVPESDELLSRINAMWALSADKILSIENDRQESTTPVFTINGNYVAQGWTEWTQGFQFGSSILQFDGTGDEQFLDIGCTKTLEEMASHVTHVGVHDHGFNNVSTYGAIRRLILEGKISVDPWQLHFCELALKSSGAVQASRWSETIEGDGYICSFNGPHSLFCDTIRFIS